ncbi:HNH endonuclease signature motif containing protein [Nitrolancea hollandica]|uniref:HNH endonuclease signature motif containing protein n=1 Tax=Nitrolancea hollandica TaxID=1206749 RepID=UPI00059111A9
MPRRPLKPCPEPGCPALVDRGRCPQHQTKRPWQGGAGGRGYGRPWRRIRDQVLTEEPFCRICGAPSQEVDHIVARADGGSDDRGNLRGLCRRCHASRTARQGKR